LTQTYMHLHEVEMQSKNKFFFTQNNYWIISDN